MRRRRPLATALPTACLVFSGLAHGADISAHQVQESDTPVIIISGNIVSGDETTFRRISLEYDHAVVLLNSMGGALAPALSIGEAIRLREYVTVVPSGSVCASACALVWLAGERRALSPSGKVGFHASYYEDNGRLIETGVGNAVIGHYLSRLNLPERAVIFATSSSPHQITWLDAASRDSSGIPFDVFSDTPAEAPQASRGHPASLDDIFRFDDPYACKMSKSMQAIFQGLVSVDANYAVTQGPGVRLPGAAAPVVPTFSRNRESGDGYDAAEVTATLSVSGTWLGLSVREIQYVFYEASSNYEYRIEFEDGAPQALARLNAHGFRLQGVGVPNVFEPDGEVNYGVVLKAVGPRSELSCGSRMFY
jgi:hypothetical protein